MNGTLLTSIYFTQLLQLIQLSVNWGNWINGVNFIEVKALYVIPIYKFPFTYN